MAAAIGWLVQTISATLKIDELDAWIRQVGLAEDIEKLKSEIRRVKIVVTAAKSRVVGNELLDEPFALLEERLDEAEGVVDELDYYRLQHQVQGRLPAPADPSEPLPLPLPLPGVTSDEPERVHGADRVDEMSRGDADTLNYSIGRLRSGVWEHFTITERDNGRPAKSVCRLCGKEFTCKTKNGTSSMNNHLKKEHSVTCTQKPPGPHPPNPSSTGGPIVGSSSGRKGKKRRSKAWDDFEVVENENRQPIKAICKYCHTEIKAGMTTGTSGMHNHNKSCKKKPGPNDQPPNSLSICAATANATPIVIDDDSSTRKRRRVDDESAQITASNTHAPWDTVTLSNMIQEIISQLQDIQGQVREVLELHGSDMSSCSNHHQSTTLDQHLRTSSLAPQKVYGRVAEKNSIIKMISGEKSDGAVVLPLVGTAGIGKTAVAQLVYNHPDVEDQFDQRIWVWVSHNFDEMRLTRVILNSISQERHEEINCFVKLQEILKSHANSKRLLLVLDNVWDDMNNIQWDKMLAPLVSPNHVNGNVILVTTRDMSVAQRLGTLKPVKLGALENDDFWLLFKSRAFGYESCEEHQSLSSIGRQIAEKLKGNPLAAVCTGDLLSKKLNTDYWRNILRNEDWKSMQHSRGIMAALKLSYDQLPYHLQQCLSYCSIFPNSYEFFGEELVGFWISHGFVKCNNSSQRMEETGQCYLIDLVNLGFFEEVKKKEPYLGSQVMYAICGLMHDFVMMVSRTDSASIDGLKCNKMPRTLRHLSIVTGSVYKKDQHGNIPRVEKFEENLRNAITSVDKLRTLVLLGHYDSFFLLLFQKIFQEAHNLRVLQMSARSANFIKYGSDEVDGAFPQVLSKLYHLQILCVGSYTDPTIPDGINNLVSLRHLVVRKGVHYSIATIGNMASFQLLHRFQFQISSGFEITKLQSTDELVQHWVHAKTPEEVYEAGLRNNELSEKLLSSIADGRGTLAWKESSADIGVELLSMDDSVPSSQPSMDTTRDVLDRLAPRSDLKDLQFSGYCKATSSIGLDGNISTTSFQTLHLYGCGDWQILPSLERYLFLTKLKLSNLPKVIEVVVPSLAEELVLVEMPKLVRCSSASVEDLSSSLRVLQIEGCQELRKFDLFEDDDKFEIEPRSWLPGLRKLILCDCPQLEVLKPLPPSTTCSELLIRGVSVCPIMKGSSSEILHIGYIPKERHECKDNDELRILNGKILAFHNLRNLKLMKISSCDNLTYFSFEGFSHLVSLTSLEICCCTELFSPDAMPENTLEDVIAANCRAFPSLVSLSMDLCGVSGKWLSLMLQHAPNLEELSLSGCEHTTVLHIPLNLVSSLKMISIQASDCVTFNGGKECLSQFTSLEKLILFSCHGLFSLLVHKGGTGDQANERWLLPKSLRNLNIGHCYQETLQPCFPGDITNLKKLKIEESPDLQSLQLHSCTALEKLMVESCESLTALEGLQFLGRLRHLTVIKCPGLPSCLESFSRLCPLLETLKIDEPSVFTTSFCKHLTSLQCLKLEGLLGVTRLRDEQVRALLLLKSLQELEFCSGRQYYRCEPVDLPAGLHTLPCLKRLTINDYPGISRLPDAGLPLSLEHLEMKNCSKELADGCRLLASSKLNVKIYQD